jgi:hypothetical protein
MNYILDDIEHQEDKEEYIMDIIKSKELFEEEYILNEVWEGMGLNALPSYVSDALKEDITSWKTQEAMDWLYNCVKNELSNYRGLCIRCKEEQVVSSKNLMCANCYSLERREMW